MKNIYLLLTLVGVMLTSTIGDASAQRTPSDTISDHEYCDQHLTINVTQPCAHQDTTAPYKVGDYYNENGKEGVVFEVWDNGRHGKIVSLDEAELQWCTSEQYEEGIAIGLTNERDGKVNTDKVMQRGDSDQYPAFVWCRNKGADWYLPAKYELNAIFNSKSAINSTLAEYNAEQIAGEYWSSTEVGALYAWSAGMGRGLTGFDRKNYDYYVRAVSAF